MPPLPATVTSLLQRLTALSDSNKTVLQLIHRLAKLDFQPGSLPLGSEADPRLELSAEIHESLKGIEEELELLRQEVEDVVNQGATGVVGRRKDSERERERARLAILLAKLSEDLKSSRSQFRKAQLTAKRSADRAKQQERTLLFSNIQSGSSTPSSLRARKTTQTTQLTADEVIASASSDVTAALRRTHQLMQSELSRSRFAQETLEQSTRALEELGEKYTDLYSLLQNSKTLVTTLVKSQKSDTWYLETAFYILVTTIIWLIFRRWLYGPITWFIWVPLKLSFRVVVAVAGIGATSSQSLTVSQPISSSTSLIVKPSATSGIPRRPIGDNQPPPYVRAGSGGGRGWGNDPSPPGSISEEVGQMAEQIQKQQGQEHVGDENAEAQGQTGQTGQEGGEHIVRGDGTVLKERDRPANPKKRVWEENIEEPHTQNQEQAQGEAGTHRHGKRDEL